MLNISRIAAFSDDSAGEIVRRISDGYLAVNIIKTAPFKIAYNAARVIIAVHRSFDGKIAKRAAVKLPEQTVVIRFIITP